MHAPVDRCHCAVRRGMWRNVSTWHDCCENETNKSVHQSLVRRGVLTEVIPASVLREGSYLRAGAFYPDAFYGCMGQSEAAETAHWPPFLFEGARIVRERRAKGADTLKLESFLIGVLTHQVADVSWHSLGLHQGLLHAMRDREFGGDYDSAHSCLDTGGDMIQMHKLIMSGEDYGWLSEPWDYSLADIRSILEPLGHRITQSQLSYCMTRGLAALKAEQNVAEAGYRFYSRKSPLLYDQLNDYYVGGMNDMHEQIAECLPNLLSWFNEPPNSTDPWDICQVFDGKRPKDPGPGDIHLSIPFHKDFIKDVFLDVKASIRPIQRFKSTPFNVTKGNSFEAQFGTGVLAWGPMHWAVAAPGESKVYVYDQSTNIVGIIDGQTKRKGFFDDNFGSSLKVWPSMGKELLLLVSSPGANRIDIFDHECRWRGGLKWPLALETYGAAGSAKQIGLSLAVDPDYRTLFVGAPYYDDEHKAMPQTGATYAIPATVLDDAVKHRKVSNITWDPFYIGEANYARAGTRLASSRRFLLIGCPGEDRVYGFDRLTLKKILTLEADGRNTGFGGYLLDADSDYIAIGAPINATEVHAGKIHIYKNTRRHTLSAGVDMAWFGYNGLLNGRSLIVTSPYANSEQGLLWNIDLNSKAITQLSAGPEPYSAAYGKSISTWGSKAMIGMPRYDEGRGGFIFYDLLALGR